MPRMQTPDRGRQWAMLALVVLVGLNLRPFLTGPGPLLADIETDTGLGHEGVAMLTLVPMLLMGGGAFLAPAIQARLGTRRAMFWALLLLMLGSLLRLVVPGGSSLIAKAAICGAGAAFIQAVFPGIMKRHFPTALPTVTGLYSAMIMGGGAAGAQLTAFLADGYGWRAALAWLALPAAITVPAVMRTLTVSKVSAPDHALTRRLLRRRRSWLLMAAFGLVNGGYASVVAWLAPHIQSEGWGVAESGSLVAAMAATQAVSALAMPMLAARSRDRRPWLCAALVMQAIGFAGLAFHPAAAPYAWAALCGAGLGGSFSLALVTALDHLQSPEQAGALTALMQGGGFLIAAVAPLAMAMLHGWSGSFASGWVMHLVFIAVTFALYLRLDPARYAEAMAMRETAGVAPEPAGA